MNSSKFAESQDNSEIIPYDSFDRLVRIGDRSHRQEQKDTPKKRASRSVLHTIASSPSEPIQPILTSVPSNPYSNFKIRKNSELRTLISNPSSVSFITA